MMQLGAPFFIAIFVTIVGLDFECLVTAVGNEEGDLAAVIAEDVLLVTKPLVKMYEMGVMKEDRMSEVNSEAIFAEFCLGQSNETGQSNCRQCHRYPLRNLCALV